MAPLLADNTDRSRHHILESIVLSTSFVLALFFAVFLCSQCCKSKKKNSKENADQNVDADAASTSDPKPMVKMTNESSSSSKFSPRSPGQQKANVVAGVATYSVDELKSASKGSGGSEYEQQLDRQEFLKRLPSGKSVASPPAFDPHDVVERDPHLLTFPPDERDEKLDDDKKPNPKSPATASTTMTTKSSAKKSAQKPSLMSKTGSTTTARMEKKKSEMKKPFLMKDDKGRIIPAILAEPTKRSIRNSPNGEISARHFEFTPKRIQSESSTTKRSLDPPPSFHPSVTASTTQSPSPPPAYRSRMVGTSEWNDERPPPKTVDADVEMHRVKKRRTKRKDRGGGSDEEKIKRSPAAVVDRKKRAKVKKGVRRVVHDSIASEKSLSVGVDDRHRAPKMINKNRTTAAAAK